MTGASLAPLVAVAVAACAQGRIADSDEAFYAWDDRAVLCAAGLDDHNRNDTDNIAEAIARAVERGEVLLLFGHKPGRDFAVDKLATVLDIGDELGAEFLSIPDLSGPPRAGVALTFDDAFVDDWYELRDLLADRGARATFFVTRFDLLSDARLDKLRDLRSDGHAIESHGHRHLDAVAYADERGVEAWVTDELTPGLDAMRARGFEPTSFAYPFGARTAALDRAALAHVDFVRAISWTHPYPLVRDACPR